MYRYGTFGDWFNVEEQNHAEIPSNPSLYKSPYLSEKIF